MIFKLEVEYEQCYIRSLTRTNYEQLMDVKKVAEEAAKYFRDKPETIGGIRDGEALVGTLEGIASGRISVGSQLVADILLEKRSGALTALTPIKPGLVRKIFAAGICSPGQLLDPSVSKDKTWADRG